MLRKIINESSEPVVGCLGVVVQAHSDGTSYKPQSGEVGMCLRVGRMGSDKCKMDRDTITRTGARTPGVEWRKPFERRCTSAPRSPAQYGDAT